MPGVVPSATTLHGLRSTVPVPRTEPAFDQDALLYALNQSVTGIWQWDTESNVNIWSDAVWRLYGLDIDTYPPCFDSWLISVHPDDRDEACALLRQATPLRQAFELTWRTNPAHGPVRWLLARGQPADRPGALFYTGVVLDITERREAEIALQALNATLEERVAERTAALSEHQHRLQHILDGIPGMVGYWGRDFRNRFGNQAYLEWFGKTPQELVGLHIREVLGEELFERNLPFMEAALRGEPQRFERDLRTRSGELRHCQAHYLPDWREGAVHGFLVMVFDISEAKAARQSAEAANQAKSVFLANISHELRTPLNAIFGLAQMGLRQPSPEAARSTFEQILATGKHLLALINDVLDFSRIEAGKMPIQDGDIDLAQLLDHVLSMCATQAEAKGLSMLLSDAPDVPGHFRGDFTRCAQILLNLVSNAIKFTDQGMVHVDVDASDATLRLTVRDTGIGIPPEAQDRLFQPFEQIHIDESRRESSTGLGLAISQRLAQLMGGNITLSSGAGQGSTFTFSLPLRNPQPVDWRPLRNLVAWRHDRIALQRLHHLLQAREPQMLLVSDLPPATQAPHALLLDVDQLLRAPPAALESLARQGCRLLVVGTSSTPPSLPPHTAGATRVIAPPLSPLRVLRALQQADVAPPPQAGRPRLEGQQILAAEDNAVNRLVLEQMLIQEGASVHFAGDGLQALELVRAHGAEHFDLVLCDIQMPLMDGYETTQALARLAPGLPVVGLTAHAFQAARERALQAGMVDYVTKPYLITPLVEAVLRHARRKPPAPAAFGAAGTSTATGKVSPAGRPVNMDANAAAFWSHYAPQPALRTRLVEALSHTIPELINQLEAALASQDSEALGRVLHNVKGTGLNLHAPMLTAQAITGLTQARSQVPDMWDTARELIGSLKNLMAALQHLHAAETPRADQ